LTVLLLVAFGLFMGLALAPTLASYASADPQALWEAGGATALFIAGFGAAGYATRRTWPWSDASPSLPSSL
jgi:modulator of FtsH protease